MTLDQCFVLLPFIRMTSRALWGARGAPLGRSARVPPPPPLPCPPGQTITWGGGLVVAQLPRNYPRPPSLRGRALLYSAAIAAATSTYYLRDNYPPMPTGPYFLHGMMAG